MKKMALAATLLAVFMMGCSDTGVDNSVASTSDVKNKQTLQNEKVAAYFSSVPEFKNEVNSEKSVGLYKTTVVSNTFQFAAYVEDEISHTYGMGLGVFVDPEPHHRGRSYFYTRKNGNPYTADIIHMYTACAKGCSWNGYDVNSFTCQDFDLKYDYDTNVDAFEIHCKDMTGNFGVVTNAAAVLNAGTDNEVIMAMAGHSRNIDDLFGILIYRKYILPLAEANAGL